MTSRAQTVTILFTDLVGSTELLQRTGDEQAQRIFKAHHRLLREAVQAHSGHEVKWLGDGLMVAFDSAHDAVRCAIAMQQASRRPTAGERLEIRTGLNVGETIIDEADYFGTPVVVARRLCDRADGGQIYASDIVVRLLDGRSGDFSTKDLGALELKGITDAVPAVEIIYQYDPMALLRKLPFAGRRAEYDTLMTKLAEAERGKGSILLLAGEPGIGKTRLTEEFCENASSQAVVIRGNCYEGDVAAPFSPWLEALRSVADQLDDETLRETAGPGATDLTVVLPELRRRLPGLEDAPRPDPESERARLFESIGAFLRNASEQRLLVIFIDDLHWCDKPSLALLEYVARGIADRRIVIVGTYRDVEVDRAHPLAQTLASLRRLEHHERLAIRGLSENAVYELLTLIEPSDQAESTRRALATLLSEGAQGNPFFIREVLNNLVETGRIKHKDGVWASSATSLDDLNIPEGAKEVIGRRLARLSDGCNAMLQRASAMTSGFAWDELRAICDEPEEELLNYLDEALGSQVLSEIGTLSYGFTHALIRVTLYEELSSPRRAALHRRIADALETLYEDDLDAHVGELAAHYLASVGGEAHKAIVYSIRAGDRAREVLAWEEAASHYERALEAMDFSKERTTEQRCHTLLALAECNKFSDRAGQNVELFREATAIARAVSSAELFGAAAVGFEEAADGVEADLTDERLALLDEALQSLGTSETTLRALALAHRVRAASAAGNARAGITAAGWFAWTGERDADVLSQAREALALAERLGDDVTTGTVIFFLHSYDWTPNNDLERLELIDRGLAAARRGRSIRLEADLMIARSMDLLALGKIDEFLIDLEHHVSLVKQLHYRSQEYYATGAQVALEIPQGKLSEAEQHLTEYSANQSTEVTVAIVSFAQLYFLRYLQGRSGEIEAIWHAILDRFRGVPIMHAAMALIQACSGKEEEAAQEVERLAHDGFAGVPRDYLWKPALFLLAEACAAMEHRTAAGPLYELLLPHASTHTAITNTIPLGPVARVVGRLATMLERFDEAEQHFSAALEENERLGFTGWATLTRLSYGDMLLRRGRLEDAGQARELLGDALSFAREAGMSKVQSDAERLLASMSAP